MTADALRARVRELMPRARADLSRLVEIPSVADPQQAPLERCREAAELTCALLADAGLEGCRLIELPDGTPPAVFGERPGPPGTPTVLLYAHYDVQPAGPEEAWDTPPFALTERDDGRWYGRGAADDKGNLVAHLTALRALGEGAPVGVKVIVEGAEEQGGGAFEPWLAHRGAPLVAADAVVVADAGNFAVGMPTITTTLRGVVDVVVTVRALRSAMHSGMFGGPAPDALVALIAVLATLHDERGNPTVRGLAADGRWPGVQYPPERYRRDATVLDGAELIGDGSVSDALWARPWVSVLGIDCPPVAGSAPALQPQAAARVSLRIPPGTDPEAAARALTDHLRGAAPWGVGVDVERRSVAAPFAAGGDGPAFRALAGALAEAYGREATTAGQGASIPLCTTLQEHLEGAEILLIGVEEPQCLIHAPNESVDPGELEHIALAEALFLQRLGSGSG